MSVIDPIPRGAEDLHWRDAMAAIRAGQRNGASRWDGIFGPLRAGQIDDLLVVGQIGQSLDGRAATATGHSHYINGTEGLDHLHRLRALMDAVVVGVGTAVADDPLLTVRRVAGPHPARVVIDPTARRHRTHCAAIHARPPRPSRYSKEPRGARPVAHPYRRRPGDGRALPGS